MLLCLDIAFDYIGWSVFHDKQPVDVGLIHAPKSGRKTVRVADERADRCAAMAGQLMDVVFRYKIQGVVGELPSGSQNAAAANLLGWAGGMVVGLCRVLEMPAEWVSQNDVKRAVTGRLNATKEEIMFKVSDFYGWEREEKIIEIGKGKRRGKTSQQITFMVKGKKFPKGTFEHIADSVGAYWASKDRNLVRLYG